MFFKIYKTTNLINGKIYIGQTHYDKPSYLGSGVLLLEAIEKYGIENFKKEYIDEAYTQDELDEKEIFWIKTTNSQDRSIGYNIADGGWNYFTMNTETKEKISKTLRGKYVGELSFRKGIALTEKHKTAISKANRGKKLSIEHKNKISTKKKKINKKDKVVYEETKKKMRKSKKGKKLSIEHKKKISESGKGRIYTDEQKEKLRLSNVGKTQVHSRTVSALCIQDKIEISFSNISSAARYFKVTRHRIKGNLVEGWIFNINNPIVSIKDLKKNSN